MLCPVCRCALEVVETEGHYGTALTVQRCVDCGGYWLDGSKAIALGFQAAVDLDGDADLDAVVCAPRDEARYCPRCSQVLEEVSGPPLPDGLHVDQCVPCRGLWFDGGELLLYKSASEVRRRGVERVASGPPARVAPVDPERAASVPAPEVVSPFIAWLRELGIDLSPGGGTAWLDARRTPRDPLVRTEREWGRRPGAEEP